MKAKDKLNFVLNLVREEACIMPQVEFPDEKVVFVFVELSSIYDADYKDDPESAPLLISGSDIGMILKKFESEGLIRDLSLDYKQSRASCSIANLDINSDIPYEDLKKRQSEDLERGIVTIAGKVVHIAGQSGRENNALRLLCTLASDVDKEWAEDEILDSWEAVDTSAMDIPRGRVYQAYKSLERKISNETGIKDFVITRNRTYRLNKEYL